MSLELHAFIMHELLPDRSSWQKSLESLGLPVRLNPDLDVSRDSGFSPCTLNGRDTGFELYVDPVEEFVAAYPQIRGKVGNSTHVISFRWGSDTWECACVVAAAAGLLKGLGAVIYDPQADVFNDLDELLGEYNKLLENESP